MLLEEAYKYCPLCGAADFKKKEKINCLECSSCNYELYINPVGSTGAIIVNEKNEVLLLKRACEPKKGWYTLPGGFIDNMETIEQGIEREIYEELGVKGKMNEFIGAYTNPYTYKGITLPTVGIIVTATIDGIPTPQEEIAKCEYFSIEDALQQNIAFDAVKRGLQDYYRSQQAI